MTLTTRLVWSLALLAGIALSAPTASAKNPGQLHFCDNGTQRWTAYDAARDNQPGFFHQEIGVGDGGKYTVTAIANGFYFDGFAYARSDARDDWSFYRNAEGVSQFSQTYDVGKWGGLFLFQLVKNGNGCRGCSVTFVMTPKNCAEKSSGGGQRGAKLCEPNYCYQEGIFGTPGRCEYSPGADGYSICGGF